MPEFITRVAVLTLVVTAVGTTAFAAEPAAPAASQQPYVGMWSKRMEHCSTKQKNPGAPMLMTDKGFDQHDLHCTFRRMEPVAPVAAGALTWSMQADCTWNGAARPMEMTLSVAGDTLTLVDRGGTSVLMRCTQ